MIDLKTQLLKSNLEKHVSLCNFQKTWNEIIWCECLLLL